MNETPNVVRIASLIGDYARAEVLSALMTGQALTATELANLAGVTKQTISSHLGKLLDAGLLACESQGRHRYFRLANQEVAHLLETMMGVAHRANVGRHRVGPRQPALRKARSCYDHLAGELAVHAYERLLQLGVIAAGADELNLGPQGRKWFERLRIEPEAHAGERRA